MTDPSKFCFVTSVPKCSDAILSVPIVAILDEPESGCDVSVQFACRV